MKPGLQLRIGQQLSITPQLQQAIRLLKLTAMELNSEIQETAESNPLLEVLELERPENRLPEDSAPYRFTSAWDEKALRGRSQSVEDWSELDNQQTDERDLRTHLLWQLALSPLDARAQTIATLLIDSINEDGYLQGSLADLMHEVALEPAPTAAEMESVLKHIQQFEPVGVAARNLQECLTLQIQNLPPETPHRALALNLVSFHLDKLARHDEGYLCKVLHIDQPTLKKVIQIVQSCHPRPGILASSEKPEYVIPDAFVRKTQGVWHVDLNEECLPKVRVNPEYAALIRRADSSADNQFLKSQLQEARWFIKSIETRQDTLLKVVKAIVAHQIEFLEHGDAHMKPLVLTTIAEEIAMHESTVSRVTTRKYLHTPRGTYELKYFFSNSVGEASGEMSSGTAIRAKIKKLIATENPTAPMSDNQLKDVLAAEGIQVARRTVAKYREALCIPPSNERKRIT